MSDLIVKDLPSRWSIVTIDDVAEVNPRLNKSEISDELLVSFVPMPAVGAGNGLIDISRQRPFSEVKKGFTAFKQGDVLFAKITPCMENGKMAVVPEVSSGYGFGSTEFHVLRPKKGLDSRYLYYFVSSQNFRGIAERYMTGAVGQKRVSKTYLKEQLLPLAPLDQQKLIVAEIEKQFSRLDEAIDNLKRVKTNLKRYKAAVLKAAVEGKLTEEWRKQHPDVELADKLLERILAERREKWQGRGKYKEPVAPDTTDLPKLPEGWVWVQLQSLVLLLGDGLHGTPNYTSGTKYYFVNGNNLNNGKIEIKPNTKTVSFEELQKHKKKLSSNTVLVSINGTLGNVGFYTGEDIVLGKSACFFNLCENASKYFIKTVLDSPYFMNYAIGSATGSTIKNLSLKSMNSFPVPLPPSEEQHHIVVEIGRQLSIVTGVELQIEANLRRADRLRQSILKKAFSGQLIDAASMY